MKKTLARRSFHSNQSFSLSGYRAAEARATRIKLGAFASLFGGSAIWNVLFLINADNARKLWPLFVIVVPLFVLFLVIVKLRETRKS